MPYIKRVVTAGKIKQVDKYYSARFGSKLNRSENRNPTPEAMEQVNLRQAVDKLSWLLAANFTGGDYHLVLTYLRDSRPDAAGGKANLECFLRQLRARLKKLGKTLKYVTVTEYRRAAIHHHLVIERADVKLLQSLWPFGRIKITPLDDSGNYRRLAEYLVKETAETFRSGQAASRKRWNASRNLVHPTPKKEIVCAETWRREPVALRGYYIDKDSVQEWIDQTGMMHQSYIMVALAAPGGARRAAGDAARRGEVCF